MANTVSRPPVWARPLTRESVSVRARPVPGPASAPAAPVAAVPTPGDRVKAVIDCLLAAVLAVPALPLVLACVALVRLTSPGPGIYRQQRVGRGGRVFTLYKIRTMYHDCERDTGPRWSLPGDRRITPLGRVLRKLHLDELPQLWNVLKGEMSLVGPRPERPEIVEKLRQLLPGYDLRHTVRPGITGFAQIHLPPDTCLRSVKNKLAYDRYYIRHRGWRLELFILFATVLKVLGLKRLYHRPPRVPTE